MTDRYNAFIVTLDKDIREDDAEAIRNAIKQINHVVNVVGNVSNIDIDESIAEERIKYELTKKIFKAING